MALGQFGFTDNGDAAVLAIGIAETTICKSRSGLAGMQSLMATLDFLYGSGGTALKAYIQTSADGGNSWFDIACWAPANANAKKIWNFSALTPVLPPISLTDGAMPDNVWQDGILGTQVRLKVVSTGRYAGNTVLSGTIVAR